jgi:hypothetical protein
MKDNLLERLKSNYKQLNENRDTKVFDKYLTESKRSFPHLTESELRENRNIIDNIKHFKLSIKGIKRAYPGISYVEARQLQRASIQMGIMEHYAVIHEHNVNKYKEKVNESCKLLLELEVYDGNDTIRPNSKLSKIMSGDPDKRLGGMDFSSDTTKSEKEPAKAANKVSMVKKFLSGIKTFIKETLKNKETYKALAIGAGLVILSSVPGAGPLLLIAKGLLGAFSIFKGSKGILRMTKEMTSGKSGIEGVKQFIINSKNPKKAAGILIHVAQIALGAWGASSAISSAISNISDVAKETATQAVSEVPQEVSANTSGEVAKAAQSAIPSDFNGNDFMNRIRNIVSSDYNTYLEDPSRFNSKIISHLENLGISADTPASEVFKNMSGNMSVQSYIEDSLRNLASAKQMISKT